MEDEDDILLPEDQAVEEEEEEGLEEAEAPEEEEAEAPEEEEEEAPRSNGMIPKHRYDSAANRAREAERELAELRASMSPKEEQKEEADPYADLDLKLEQARADGDTAAAAGYNKQIRQMERAERDAEHEQRSQRTSESTRESIRLDSTIEALNTQYPNLDPDSDTYDQDSVDEVLRLQRAFVSSGTAPSTALQDAVRYVMPKGVAAAEPAEPAQKRKTDVKKNVDTANKQPPGLDKVGFDSDNSGKKDVLPDVNDLTEEEFDALPESTKRKMRGDVN